MAPPPRQQGGCRGRLRLRIVWRIAESSPGWINFWVALDFGLLSSEYAEDLGGVRS
jgi:hypothetical protein